MTIWRCAPLVAGLWLCGLCFGESSEADTPSEDPDSPEAEAEQSNASSSAKKENGKFWLDEPQQWTTEALYNRLVWLDSMFYGPGLTQREDPRSRFRLSIFNVTDLEQPERPRPDMSISASVRLPGLRDRFRLEFLSEDLQDFPSSGADPDEGSTRLALRRVGNWLDVDVGGRLKLPPVLFVRATARYTWAHDPVQWNLAQRVFYETDEGFGEITSLSQHMWLARKWMLGHHSSVRWSEATVGAEWQDALMIAFVADLMEEGHEGRFVGRRDMDHGLGFHTRVRGRYDGGHAMTNYRVGFVYRRPLFRRDYLYLEVLPEVEWKAENDWREEYTLRMGIDILFWRDR
ncbi:MAG: hypothetical protein JJU29_06010 [Verrucomicrobia bacterium]|nr:hypothetical protein [Verrucomicrobiota bacterium]MCH8511852.1 hypothetical protein [Kiritimatiellia bacterium]